MLKTVSSITNAIGALNFQGTWNASTNTPTLASGVGTKGDYFVVGTAGTTTLDGISNWGVGDWATYNGSVWQRVEGGADLNGVNASLSGNLAFTGTGNRITGDFSNATGDNRVIIQTSTANSATNLGLIPNGSGTASIIDIHNASNSTNAGKARMAVDGSAMFLASSINGTGTYLPMAFLTGGIERVRVATTGVVGIGTSSPASDFKFTVSGDDTILPGINVVNSTAIASFYSSSSLAVVATRSNHPLAFQTNSSERMRIATNGIVTMNAYGAGTATFSAAGVISSVSDETWKIKDGVPVDPDSMLKKLEPGYWYYNDEKKETFGADRQLGFYAQNVNAAIGPEAAPTPKEGKPWGYYDRSVLAVTVMSLQKALATIESLTARITALENK